MKKNIAILTQPLGHNYGGIIQNYALQRVLQNLDFTTTTLDIRKNINYFQNSKYNFSKVRWIYYFILNETKHRMEGRRKIIPSEYYYNYIHEHTFNFIKKNIKISNTLHQTVEVSEYFNKNKFDIVIVGSDQVWRPIYSPNIFNFYLDFLQDNKDVKKISYAASFGTSTWEYTEEQKKKCSNLINKFDNISVREASGVEICKNKFNIDAIQVLDPTLLLSSEEYIKLFDSKKKNRKGIFSYILDETISKNEIVNNLKMLLNMEVFRNQPQFYYNQDKTRNPEFYKIPKLEEWLKAFYEADYIITDSFHGTVFSIIFKKQFIVMINEDRGGDRFITLLNNLGLDNRIYSSNKDLNSYINDVIDYVSVDSKIQTLKESSLEFLINSLKN